MDPAKREKVIDRLVSVFEAHTPWRLESELELRDELGQVELRDELGQVLDDALFEERDALREEQANRFADPNDE
jgi:2-oxo-4-hydroxy-4-carboxy--5-ureidoimidazoline (OHCU) decarboxylase